jgi:hypothetical protein
MRLEDAWTLESGKAPFVSAEDFQKKARRIPAAGP